MVLAAGSLLRPSLTLFLWLGASLWTTLEYLQQHAQKTVHPQVDIKYDVTSPANSPVLLHIRPHLDLVFSPLSHRLTLISLRQLHTSNGTPLIVKYKDKIVSSSGSPTGDGRGTILRRGGVNQGFGPTYVGDVMRYPGVWFGFEEDGVGSPTGIPTSASLGHGKEDRNQEVKRIVVTRRQNEGDGPMQDVDPMEEPTECPEMEGDIARAVITVRESSLIGSSFCSCVWLLSDRWWIARSDRQALLSPAFTDQRVFKLFAGGDSAWGDDS